MQPRVCPICGMESIAPMLQDARSYQFSVVAKLLQANFATYCCDVGHLFIVSIDRRVKEAPGVQQESSSYDTGNTYRCCRLRDVCRAGTAT